MYLWLSGIRYVAAPCNALKFCHRKCRKATGVIYASAVFATWQHPAMRSKFAIANVVKQSGCCMFESS